MHAPTRALRVGMYTECYRPLVNGVVASVETLRDGLQLAGANVTIVAPQFPNSRDDARAAIVRLPSLPLPTPTDYRLCIPLVARNDRARTRAFDIVHAHSPFVTGWTAKLQARYSRVPLIYTYHTRIDEYAHYARFEPRITRRAMIELTRAYANAADAVIVPTHAMEMRLREIGVKAPLAVVPSAIDVTRFTAGERSSSMRERLGARDDEPLVLCVSRLAREKNIELLIDALAYAPGVRLAVVGEGPDRASLVARARAGGNADRVYFAGAFAPADMPAAYASADAFAFASTTETQGLVLAEALAAGLPVVALEGPVTREVLGSAGRLTGPDAPAFGRLIAAAVERPRDPGAGAAAAANFGRTLHALRVLRVYRDVLAARIA